jgi:hypothetical protein
MIAEVSIAARKSAITERTMIADYCPGRRPEFQDHE